MCESVSVYDRVWQGRKSVRVYDTMCESMCDMVCGCVSVFYMVCENVYCSVCKSVSV